MEYIPKILHKNDSAPLILAKYKYFLDLYLSCFNVSAMVNRKKKLDPLSRKSIEFNFIAFGKMENMSADNNAMASFSIRNVIMIVVNPPRIIGSNLGMFINRNGIVKIENKGG